MTSPAPTLIIPTRFHGPASSGNGGWSAGALVAALTGSAESHGPIEVTLRKPPPLETEMAVSTADDGSTVLLNGTDVVAVARRTDLDIPVSAPVDADSARAAMARYPGFNSHPFPSCFACGPDRAEGDGLRIFPGEVGKTPDGRRQVAAAWTPHPSLNEGPYAGLAATWASLDCSSGWTGDLTEERPMVLGRITARIDRQPKIGEEHVLVGERLNVDGRKTFSVSSLYDASGELLATATQVWIAVDLSD